MQPRQVESLHFKSKSPVLGIGQACPWREKKDVNVKQSQLANFIQELVYNQLKVIK